MMSERKFVPTCAKQTPRAVCDYLDEIYANGKGILTTLVIWSEGGYVIHIPEVV